MIVKRYIKDFEKLGFGMFVHFGLYSILGEGEWVMNLKKIPDAEYSKLADRFCPEEGWADRLAETAKDAGCRYITLTTRHHDGFSLYDTQGLSDYDTVHTACKRDLVAEFTAACRKQGLIPFFYHTLLDWHQPSYREDFKSYLVYLRKSVEVLCTHYGKIGGIWFDGMWDRPDDDWEEDALYGMIRSHQPEAMIINNTGLNARGALGHIELDSVTFERGKPSAINQPDAPKYIASEMCEVFSECWGYGADDLNYQSPAAVIEELAECRRSRSNFLLNTGPMPSGELRLIDKGIFQLIGRWTRYFDEALHEPAPCDITVTNKERDFILKSSDDRYFLFCFGLHSTGDANVAILQGDDYTDRFPFPKKIRRVFFMDDGLDLEYEQTNGETVIHTKPYALGHNLKVRVAEIITE